MADTTLGCTSVFLTLATERFDDLVSFYRDLLGQGARRYQRDRYAEFQLPGLRLAIFRPRPDQAAQFSAPTSDAISLCVEVVDLDAAIAHLAHLGYPPPAPVLTASHGREVYVYDPDGNRLILHQSFTELA
ncbi:MAG: VOC family protein [Nodosilinea sp.]